MLSAWLARTWFRTPARELFTLVLKSPKITPYYKVYGLTCSAPKPNWWKSCVQNRYNGEELKRKNIDSYNLYIYWPSGFTLPTIELLYWSSAIMLLEALRDALCILSWTLFTRCHVLTRGYKELSTSVPYWPSEQLTDFTSYLEHTTGTNGQDKQLFCWHKIALCFFYILLPTVVGSSKSVTGSSLWKAL